MGRHVAARSFAASAVVRAGTLGDDPWRASLRSCVVDENTGLPDSAVLVYDDGTHELLAKTGLTIGSPLQVLVSSLRSNAEEPLFSGEVTAVELDVDDTGAFTVIRAMSRAHRLFRGRRVEAFRKMTAATIVRQVARNAGFTVGRIEASNVTYQHISQAGVSDWDFLQTLARDQGAVVGVDDKGRLEFTRPRPAASAPPPSNNEHPHVLAFGHNLVALRAALTSAELANGVEVRGWDVTRKQPVVATRNNTPSRTVKPGLSASNVFRTRTRTLAVDTPYTTEAEATAAAGALEASISAGFAELEAVVHGHPKLRAGVPVTLADMGPAFTGSYTATAVTHVLDPDVGYRTTVLVSATPDRSLAGLTAPVHDVRMPGLAIGIVTDVRETDGQRGWVRLRFPWLDDNYVTDWVRTVQLGGVGGGGVFGPDVNDEVLVGFEQGSLDRPYVIGGLYNGVDKPSPHTVPLVDRRSGQVNRRSLVSRKGNRLELLDGTQVSGVRVATGDKQLEVVLDERGKSLELNVRKRGGRQVTSSIRLDSTGITLDAKRGEVRIKGRTIRLN